MRIKYCRKFRKYASRQYCEFFNEGLHCEFSSHWQWESIADLLRDENRPLWEVNKIIKPFNCHLKSGALFQKPVWKKFRA